MYRPKKKKTLSQLDKGRVTRQARNSRQCPEKETIKKKKTLSQLGDGTVTRQARNSRQCPEKETIKKKINIESTRQWNGHKKS